MRKRDFVFAALGAVLLTGNSGVACGDKLLVIGRGVRFQHVYGARPANVVLYSNGPRSGAALRSASLQATLKRAGHKLQTADGAVQLGEALRSGKVDVVLADFADVSGIAQQLQAAPSKPVVLPVLFRPSKAELSAAQTEYKLARKAPADEIQYLSAIDEAMKLKARISPKS